MARELTILLELRSFAVHASVSVRIFDTDTYNVRALVDKSLLLHDLEPNYILDSSTVTNNEYNLSIFSLLVPC
jgi:hypothetical protein